MERGHPASSCIRGNCPGSGPQQHNSVHGEGKHWTALELILQLSLHSCHSFTHALPPLLLLFTQHLDNLSERSIVEVVIPSAIPLVYTFAQDNHGQVLPLGRPSSLGMKGRFVVTRELLELNLAASQNLEMSENLDEGDDFKLLISDTLRKVKNVPGIGMENKSSFDAEITSSLGGSARSSIMEAGWMTFDATKNLRVLDKLKNV